MAGGWVKTRGAHGDDFDRIARLHSGNRIAGVNGALKRVWAVHFGDVADLAYVQLGGHARGHVFAVGCGREQDVGVVAGDGQNLRGYVLSQTGF
jgi:hypothetical protein